jgi:Flp pilus assembly pilin Flp
VEYALIAVFVAVVVAAGITVLGLLVNGFFSSGGTAVTTVAPEP